MSLQQVNLAGAVHLALHELELRNLSFGLAVRPRQRDRGLNCGSVLIEAAREGGDETRHGHPSAVRDVNEDLGNPDPFDDMTEAEADLKRRIDEMASIDAVTDLMLDADTQRTFAQMPSGTRDEMRGYKKARLVALGWPPNKPGRRSA